MTRATVVCVLALTASPVSAQAQRSADERRIEVDLPAGPLGVATDALARQAGLSIVVGDPSLWQRRVPQVRERMSAATAVRILARLADANARRIGTLSWRLTPQVRTLARKASAAPPSVPVAAPLPEAATGEVVVLASKRSLPARLMAGSLEVIATPPPGIEAGTAALVTRSTIISSTYRGAGREKLFLRGIADSSFSGGLQSVTGLYFGDVRMTYNAADPDLQLYDLSSVEVLEGPQGTLYGSGSMAGIIRLNPVMPVRRLATGSIGVGLSKVAHGAIGGDTDAVLNVPMGENLSVRAVGYARSEGGFIDRPGIGRDVNRRRIEGARISARWWLSDGWTVDAVALGQISRTRDSQYAAIGAPLLTVTGRIPEPFGGRYAAGHLVVTGTIGDVTLVSATGVARQRFDERFASEGSLITSIIDMRRRYDLLTHETRLSRLQSDGSSWILGSAITRSRTKSTFDDARSLTSYATPKPEFMIGLKQSVWEWAVFGEINVPISSALSVGAGARAVHAETNSTVSIEPFPFPVTQSPRRLERWILPTASVLLRADRQLSGYLRYQQSVRAAAPDIRILPGNEAPRSRERVGTIDAGVKWHSAGGWAAEASMARSRWRDLQFDSFEGASGFTRGGLGDWRLTSTKLELRAPLGSSVRTMVAFAHNQSAQTGGRAASANPRIPEVADVIARGEVSWDRPLNGDIAIHLTGWVRYDGRSYGNFPGRSTVSQGDYVRAGIRVEIERRADQLSLSVDNLFDSSGVRSGYGSIVRAGLIRTPLPPATARIGYRRRF